MSPQPRPHNHYDYTELNAAIRSEPHPLLDVMRARCPVAHDPDVGAWLLTRFSDAAALLADDTLSRDPAHARPGSRLAEQWRKRPDREDAPESDLTGFFFASDTDHARLRGIIAKHLSARVGAMRNEIADLTGELLDTLATGNSFDVVEDYATPLPVAIIGRIIGIGPEHHTHFREWSDSLALSFLPDPTPVQSAQRWASIKAIEELLHSLLRQRRATPRDDLISDLLLAQSNGAPISDAEIVDNCGMLVLTGNTTTTDLITAGIYLLLTNPDEEARLRADPKRIVPIVEEVLRFAAIASLTGRIVTRDLTFGDVTVPHGGHVVASLLAANHDPACYPEPHRFDASRAKQPSLAFGAGKRSCIGAPLATAEARHAIGALFKRFDRIEIVEPTVRLRALPGFRSIERLRVQVA